MRIQTWLLAVTAGLFLSTGAKAQLCFDAFLENSDPLLQCADTDFFLAPVDGGFGALEEFTGSDIGRTSASFDGSDLFDPGERPSNVLDPFFSSVELSTTLDGMGTTSFSSDHRGSVSMAPADSLFQSTAYGTRSRITFIPINMGDPGSPTTIRFDLNYTFTLEDPRSNAGTGAALGGFGVQFIGANAGEFEDPQFDVSALAELDLDETTFEPEFFGFDDPELDDATVEIDFEPPSPEIDDVFDIEIDIELEIDIDDFDLDIDEPIVLELDTFGSIFSDGFESGDTAAWSASSPDTFSFTISSNDPNVRFIIIPEPSSAGLILIGACGLLFRRRR